MTEYIFARFMGEIVGVMIGSYVVAAICSALTEKRYFTKRFYKKEDYKTYKRHKMYLIYWSIASIYCFSTVFRVNRVDPYYYFMVLAFGVFLTTLVVKVIFIGVKKLFFGSQKVSSDLKEYRNHVVQETKSSEDDIHDVESHQIILRNDENHSPSLSESEEYWGLISFAYGKIKQTSIFRLWRREQFDCQFGKCAICGRPMEIRFAQVDHIKPRYRKGTNYSNNLALVHKDCNMKKGAKIGFEKPTWIKDNKYSEKFDEKVYEITEAIRAEYPTKFPEDLFVKPTNHS